MNAQEQALQLLDSLSELLSEKVSDERTAELTDTMVDIVETIGGEAILPIWARCTEAEDATVRRTLSYVLATKPEGLGSWVWVTLLWLVASPASNDESGIINTITALKDWSPFDDTLLAALRPHFASFVCNAIQRSNVAREATVDLVDALSDSRVLRDLLAKPDTDRIAALFAEARQHTDEDGIRLIDGVADTLASERWAPHLPDGADTLRNWVHTHSPRSPTDAWSEALSFAERTAADYVSRSILFDSFAADVETQFAAYDIRVTKHWADHGRVPFEFFQKLLSSWRRLYLSVRATVAPNPTDEPNVYVLAPAYGSFSARMLVEPTSDGAAIEDATAEKLANGLGSVTSRGEHVPEKQLTEYTAFLDLVSTNDVNVEVGVATALRHRVRARVVVSSQRARAVRAALVRRPSSEGEQITMTGTLDAANHRSGQFEILPLDGTEPIKGTQRANARRILLRRTIGQTYSFRLLREGPEAASHWTILGLSRLGPSVVEDDDVGVGDSVVPELPRPSTPPRIDRKRVTKKLSQDRGTSSTGSKLTSREMPQVDNLAGMIEVVELLSKGVPLSADALGLSGKYVDRARLYIMQAARILNLITHDETLTPEGRKLAKLPKGERLDYLASLVAATVVVKAWMRWAKVDSIRDLDAETAKQFLLASGQTKKMAERRGRTIRRWVRDIRAGRLEPLRHR